LKESRRYDNDVTWQRQARLPHEEHKDLDAARKEQEEKFENVMLAAQTMMKELYQLYDVMQGIKHKLSLISDEEISFEDWNPRSVLSTRDINLLKNLDMHFRQNPSMGCSVSKPRESKEASPQDSDKNKQNSEIEDIEAVKKIVEECITKIEKFSSAASDFGRTGEYPSNDATKGVVTSVVNNEVLDNQTTATDSLELTHTMDWKDKKVQQTVLRVVNFLIFPVHCMGEFK
jgi:hypothetical protein